MSDGRNPVVSDEKASPGPWRFEEGPAYESSSIRDANGDAVVMAHVENYEYPCLAVSLADAALIADAPAMLDLLRDIEQRTPALPGVFKVRLAALLDKHGRTP